MNLQTATAVAAGIEAEYEAFQAFHRILQEEKSALVRGDIEHLLQLAPRKNELLDQLTLFSDTRNKNLSSTGHENNASGMEAWLSAIGADGKTRETWRSLINLAREAEQLNRANGVLIETSLRHNQQALSVLQTAANPGNSLYGPNGHISSLAAGRPIDKV